MASDDEGFSSKRPPPVPAKELDLNFFSTITSVEAAEAELEKLPARGYLTWQGDEEDTFILSYNSAAFRRMEHVKVFRLPDGSWFPEVSREQARYPSLEAFVASRSYISAVRKGSEGAALHGGLSSLPLHAKTGGRRVAGAAAGAEKSKGSDAGAGKKGKGAAGKAGTASSSNSSSSKGTAGSKRRKYYTEDGEELSTPPTCGHGLQKAILTVAALIALCMLTVTGTLNSRHAGECQGHREG